MFDIHCGLRYEGEYLHQLPYGGTANHVVGPEKVNLRVH
jgi:hypothetical protein